MPTARRPFCSTGRFGKTFAYVEVVKTVTRKKTLSKIRRRSYPCEQSLESKRPNGAQAPFEVEEAEVAAFLRKVCRMMTPQKLR